MPMNAKPWLPSLLAGGGVLLLLAVALLLWRPWGGRADLDGRAIPKGQAQELQLYFAQENSSAYTEVLLVVAKTDSLRQQMSRLIARMCKEPGKAGEPSLWPLAFKVRSAYLRSGGILILDFEKAVQYNQGVGAYTELLAARSLLRTITANYSEVQSVQFLFGGQESETLAGHIDISRPLALSDVSQ